MHRLFGPVALVCAGLLTSGLIVSGPAASAATVPDDRGAAWLSRQLTDGLVYNEQYDFNDYGLTADTALALTAIGGHWSAVRQIRRALARDVDAWTTSGKGATGDVYAGSVAKALVVAQVTGADPRQFGGVNLVTRLNRRVSMSAPTVGRIQDKGADDYANTIGQAFAARGLSRAGSPKADEVVRFLLKQQCSRGYFRLDFAAKTAPDQTCDGGSRATSAPDTDVTALAVLNLQWVPDKSRKVRTAITDGLRWLKRHQQDNGSFGGGPATEGSNTNSTGLAGWALGEAGSCSAAQDAARWVARLQVRGDVSGTPLAGERGAIAYNRAAFRAAERDGITTETRDQWRRATAQAAPALRYLRPSACP